TYGTMYDTRDGKQYNTIRIGNQVWMVENLRYAGNITLGTQGEIMPSLPRRYNPNNDADNVETNGYLYNWPAAMNGESSTSNNPSEVQGICPNGWHLPSAAEWQELYDTLGGNDRDAGAQLAYSYYYTYDYGDVIAESEYLGASGFDAIFPGIYAGSYSGAWESTYFWSATENTSNGAYYRQISTSSTQFMSGSSEKYYGYSVRCAKGTAYYAYDTLPYCGSEFVYRGSTFTESGDYKVRVNLSEDTDSIYMLHLTMYPALTATVSSYSNGCFGGNNGYVAINATGGAENYAYSWNTPEAQNVSRLENLGSGEYVVTVTDSVGCTATVSQTITAPSAALAASFDGDDQVCEGNQASITATANGGTPDYTYAWSNGANTNVMADSPATTTTYVLTVTDAGGCTVSDIFTVTVNPAATLVLTSAEQNQSLCYGDTFETIVFTYGGAANGANVTGLPNGVLYTVNQTDNTVQITGMPTETGSFTYTVTTTGATSPCENISLVGTITISPQILVSVADHTDINCFGESTGSVTLDVSGGIPEYTYSWNNDSTTQNLAGITAGTYSVVVTDAGNCTAGASVTISQPDALSATISTTETIICYGGTLEITASATGGTQPYIYAWGDNLGTSSNITVGAGTYAVTATDRNGCSVTASTVVSQPDQITSEISQTACESFDWNDITYTESGNYTRTFTATNGCDSIVTLNLTINHSQTELVEVSACDSYEWNDSIYTETGEYTQTL
ncbi:MAG: hypothetical protein II037_05250, partial [Bacteroidales bacterium]|nr:hypothetical protein [Bacteroidales bacterium]